MLKGFSCSVVDPALLPAGLPLHGRHGVGKGESSAATDASLIYHHQQQQQQNQRQQQQQQQKQYITAME